MVGELVENTPSKVGVILIVVSGLSSPTGFRAFDSYGFSVRIDRPARGYDQSTSSRVQSIDQFAVADLLPELLTALGDAVHAAFSAVFVDQ